MMILALLDLILSRKYVWLNTQAFPPRTFHFSLITQDLYSLLQSAVNHGVDRRRRILTKIRQLTSGDIGELYQ